MRKYTFLLVPCGAEDNRLQKEMHDLINHDDSAMLPLRFSGSPKFKLIRSSDATTVTFAGYHVGEMDDTETDINCFNLDVGLITEYLAKSKVVALAAVTHRLAVSARFSTADITYVIRRGAGWADALHNKNLSSDNSEWAVIPLITFAQVGNTPTILALYDSGYAQNHIATDQYMQYGDDLSTRWIDQANDSTILERVISPSITFEGESGVALSDSVPLRSPIHNVPLGANQAVIRLFPLSPFGVMEDPAIAVEQLGVRVECNVPHTFKSGGTITLDLTKQLTTLNITFNGGIFFQLFNRNHLTHLQYLLVS